MARRRVELINPGERFGRLVVKRERPDGLVVGSRTQRAYECECDCGEQAVATLYDLRAGRRVSCGCSRGGPGSGRVAVGFSKHHYYLVTKQGAESRNLEFTLTREEYADLVSHPCTFCGSDDRIGVDRKDSRRGYTSDNAQPLCWPCNHAKASQSNSEFLDWVTRVYENSVPTAHLAWWRRGWG